MMSPFPFRASATPDTADPAYQSYIEFFEKVYQTMADNYYQPPSREKFEHFLEQFRTKIYAQLSDTGKSIDYIRWRSANIMVEQLRESEDIFSTFYPPKPAQEYKETALGQRVDLGIEGAKSDAGFKTDHIEPRSDAYQKGLRPGDILLEIDGKDVRKLTDEEIRERLTPLIDTKVVLAYKSAQTNEKSLIEVVSQEYFKQTVFMCPTEAPGVFCLQIERFNRKTSEDMALHMNFIKQHGPVNGIILDLRGNPGGPPLAAREIASFFLPGGDEFAYFQKRGEPKASLDVPTIPDQYKFDGPLAILVDQKSGSSAELFSGIMQRRQRAALLGKSTAGQVFLKSMFPFEDESMLLLVTARGHFPDGSVFSFNGLTPDRPIEEGEEADLIKMASIYLMIKANQ
jgi:carboxyl-terminal processing protease